MTQDKDLLLKDLCARLPYGVKVSKVVEDWTSEPNPLRSINLNNIIVEDGEFEDGTPDIDIWDYEDIKPYLFPLSSMTEEQTKEVHNLIYQGVSESVDETKEWLKTRKENELRPITLAYILNDRLVIDWLNKNHFDYRRLIERGLAIDCTNLNIY